VASIETPAHYVQSGNVQHPDPPDPDARFSGINIDAPDPDARFSSINFNGPASRRSSFRKSPLKASKRPTPSPIATYPPNNFWSPAGDAANECGEDQLRKQGADVSHTTRTYKVPSAPSSRGSPAADQERAGGTYRVPSMSTASSGISPKSKRPVSRVYKVPSTVTTPVQIAQVQVEPEGDGDDSDSDSVKVKVESKSDSSGGEDVAVSIEPESDSEDDESVEIEIESESDSDDVNATSINLEADNDDGDDELEEDDGDDESADEDGSAQDDQSVEVRIESVSNSGDYHSATARRNSRVAADVARIALREWARIEECNRLHSHLPGGLVIDDEGQIVECDCPPLTWGLLDKLRK
jgi:hypothetical protein